MKKLVLSIVSLMLLTFAQAQSVESGNTQISKSAKDTAGKKSYMDFLFGWSDNANAFSFKVGGGVENGGYFNIEYVASIGEQVSVSNFYLGYGLQKSFLKSDSFLIYAKIWPYIGYTDVEYDYGSESEMDFTYGASAQLEAGTKIYTFKDKTLLYLTVGYDIIAPEFETEGIFENGTWRAGVTVRF